MTWNLDGDEKWLSDGDHIKLETSCDGTLDNGHVRSDYDGYDNMKPP